MSNDAALDPDWAYARDTLMEVPDGARIERHGHELINHGLATGRTVAFVGAGASMAYGRLAWRDLVLAAQERARAIVVATGTGDPRIKRAKELLDRHEIKAEAETESTRFPVLFQLAEQVHELAERSGRRDSGLTGGGRAGFRQRAMDDLRDDLGHAKHIWREVLTEQVIVKKADCEVFASAAETTWEFASAAKTRWEDDPWKTAEQFVSEHCLREVQTATSATDFRSLRYLNELVDGFSKHQSSKRMQCLFQKLADIIISYARAPSVHGTAYALIRPYHRFMIGLALRVYPVASRCGMPSEDRGNPPHAVWSSERSFRRRGDLLPPNRDPLLLVTRLGISRFLTTNYDHEIRRLFEDEGLNDATSRRATPGATRANPLGQSMSTAVFERTSSGHLLVFAARNRGEGAEVVHLHGLAEAGGHIVVTEADYQARYVAEHTRAGLMEDAISAAFGSSPLLFIGSGFTEDDLLRPLREFLGDAPRPGEKNAVALLPVYDDNNKVEADKIRNLQRFGVYTVHYGYAAMKNGDVATPWLREAHKTRNTLRETLAFVSDSFVRGEPGNLDPATLEKHRRDVSIEKLPPLQEPHALEDCDIAGHPELSVIVEIQLLNAAADFARLVLEFPSFKGEAERTEVRQLALAYLAAVKGAMDSVTGSFLCAKLISLGRSASEWRREWSNFPRPAGSSRYVKDWKRGTITPVRVDGSCLEPMSIHRRHPTVHPAEDAAVLPGAAGGANDDLVDARWRFFDTCTSQSLMSFFSALACQPALNTAPEGRRIFLVIGSRGAGKGDFFGTLQNPARIGTLLGAIGAGRTKEDETTTTWPAALFINLSFSHEVSSAFDLLSSWIHTTLQTLLPTPSSIATEMEQGYSSLRTDRVRRLKFLLKILAARASPIPGKRLLIVINGLSTIFDSAGIPKNADVAKFFEDLVGPEASHAPLDLILIGSIVPKVFRADPGSATDFGFISRGPRVELRRKQLSVRQTAKLDSYNQQIFGTLEQTPPEPWAYVHHLRRELVSVLAIAFFPSVALSIGWRLASNMGLTGTGTLDAGQIQPDAARRTRRSVGGFLKEWTDISLGRADVDLELQTLVAPMLIAAGTILYLHEIPLCDVLADNTLRCPTDWSKPRERADVEIRNRLIEAIGARIEVPNLAAQFENLCHAIDAECRDIALSGVRSRYSVTLLLCGAYQFLVPVAEASDPAGIDVAWHMQEATSWLNRFCGELRPLSFPRREDLIIERMLQLMGDQHALVRTSGAPHPLPLRAAYLGYFEHRGAELLDLQMTLLWHVAVIGTPVEAEVLARCPRVCEALEKVMPALPGKLSRDKVDLAKVIAVNGGLRLLESRCLVFRVHRRDRVLGDHVYDVPPSFDQLPSWHARSGELPPMEKRRGERIRWTVHRLVQRHVFQRLGAPFIEYPAAELVNLTLYASQPDELPRLTPQAHRDLHRTVAALIGYPEADDQGDAYRPRDSEYAAHSGSPRTVNIADHTTAIEGLRAAFGMIRSIYSLSVLSRLDPRDRAPARFDDRGPPLHRGFLEEHRLLIRWMLKEALWLQGPGPAPTGDPVGQKAAPFYVEEIAWLYNEVGVLSLAEGRIAEAWSFFGQAESVARDRMETSNVGTLHVRIAMNRGLADIERGRLNQAREAFERIRGLQEKHPDIRLVATGYLGLVEHITGRHTEAEKHYKTALEGHPDFIQEGLIVRRRSRAAAIVSRQYGDLKRSQRDYSGATQILEQALMLASEGGHEDIRNAVVLSQLHAEYYAEEHLSASKLASLHARLNVVENYGRVMGLARLTTEADLIRCRLLRAGGDLRAAASVASRGLTVAAASEMRLRKTSLLLELAEIQAQRKMDEECRVLLFAALEAARDSHYHSVFISAQELLAKVVPIDGPMLPR